MSSALRLVRRIAVPMLVIGLVACASSHTTGPGDDAGVVDAVVIADASGKPFGEPCTDGLECASGTCYQAHPPDPGFCTSICNFDCPEGYACKTVSLGGFDNRVCLPAVDTFCQTCANDEDCGDDSDACVQLTDGKFCSIDCSNDPTVCAAGFTCQTIPGQSGELAKHQCIPLNGVCCIDGDNDRHGVGGGCLGADCDDTKPTVYNGGREVCDSLDNDCNTQIDDDPLDCAAPLCELGALGYYARTGDVCNGTACVQQAATLCDLYTCEGGGEDGDLCAVTCDGEVDTRCIPAAHCDSSACLADVGDGQVCDEDSDCTSSHCQNGFCCGQGDCCQQADDCPTFGTFQPVCDAPSSCQGSRGAAVCSSAFTCTTQNGVPDDSACVATTEANDCGYYQPIFCSGAGSQTAPACPTTCTTHADCDANAFCNPQTHTCQADLDDGQACATDDLRCVSGHCGNGFCCANGDCCATATDCPSTYTRAPSCTSPSACDGDADVAACTANICNTVANVDDDSACGPTTVASTCGAYTSINCTGSATQTAPQCPDTCTSDADCDANAYCNAAGACVPDEPDGGSCTGAQQCQAAHCQNGFCCAGGDCCAQDNDCNAYDVASSCSDTASCQGTRVDGVCGTTHACGPTTVADDSGCAGLTSSDCGPYPAVACSNQPSQSAPTCPAACLTDGECDPSAHCNTSAHTCEADQGQGGFCVNPQDCGSGLTCVDSVCCNTACNGSCQACDLPGSVGTCTNVPGGQDPDNECGGVSCAGYYYGWSGDSCQRKADVPSNVAACSGGSSCRTQATECSAYNVAGPVTTTCNSGCQDPTGGTCTGTIAGACNNVNPGTQTCGTGECQRTINQCANGAPLTCTPGNPSTETCNYKDDNCDGTADNGAFSDTYEANGSCAAQKTLATVGSKNNNDNAASYASMTIYGAGDYDYYAIPLTETDNSCGCGVSFDEDYTLTVQFTAPAFSGGYEICLNTSSDGAAYCNWPNGYCFGVSPGETKTITQNIDGACPGGDSYTTYLRVRGVTAPGFECHPYALSYKFESGFCR